jgi:hypothetical protein
LHEDNQANHVKLRKWEVELSIVRNEMDAYDRRMLYRKADPESEMAQNNKLTLSYVFKVYTRFPQCYHPIVSGIPS